MKINDLEQHDQLDATETRRIHGGLGGDSGTMILDNQTYLENHGMVPPIGNYWTDAGKGGKRGKQGKKQDDLAAASAAAAGQGFLGGAA